LDLEELLSGAHLLGLTEDDARFLFSEIDTDGGGEIEVDEFLAKCGRSTTTAKLGRFAQDTESSLATKVERKQPSVLAARAAATAAMAAAQANMAAAAGQLKVHRPERSGEQTAEWIAKYASPKSNSALVVNPLRLEAATPLALAPPSLKRAAGAKPVVKRPAAPTQRVLVVLELPSGVLADAEARRQFIEATALRLGVLPEAVAIENVPLATAATAPAGTGSASASNSRASTPALGGAANSSDSEECAATGPLRNNELSHSSSSKSSTSSPGSSFKMPALSAEFSASASAAVGAYYAGLGAGGAANVPLLSPDYNHYATEVAMRPSGVPAAARPSLTSVEKATVAGAGRAI
jgi:hypothetical protein